MGVLNPFLPGGGEFAHQKNSRAFALEEWSGLELTDTLIKSVIEGCIAKRRRNYSLTKPKK